ncbi:16S rRNA (uracil(1498)-N(3))-methyltransferase [Mangrovibacillus cuniculi]|uniref:RsmE family RNA methyltransferase n=1 Tax=Mangrovibacillus cuniculi TaxID=2593652 RepID=UPI00308466AC
MKADKWEYVIQKGTELGAHSFIPLKAARSVVKWDEKKGDKKVERWTKIASEAAEQSHRQVVPNVDSPVTLKQLLQLADEYTHKIVAYEEEARSGDTTNFSTVLQSMKSSNSVMMVFGPEGGLTEEEVTQLLNKGFVACALGPRILRAETAPLYALSALSYKLELER